MIKDIILFIILVIICQYNAQRTQSQSVNCNTFYLQKETIAIIHMNVFAPCLLFAIHLKKLRFEYDTLQSVTKWNLLNIIK